MKNNININNETKFFAVIGDPISHSLSPVFQNYFINKRNINAIYIPLHITTESLGHSMDLLKNNFHGFNVTIPHKENIMEYLDEIDPLAMEYGAVNTVKNLDGRFIGYNTDGIGFTKSIEKIDINIRDSNVLLLGAGGAGKVIASEIIKSHGNLTIANRSIDRANKLKSELEKLYKSPVNICPLNNIDGNFDIIINTTSVGMYPHMDKSPVNLNVIKNSKLVYDVIYNPFETKLLQIGKELGTKTINGLPMLVYQGLSSFEIWTGKKATYDEELEIYNMLKSKLMED
ncbi:MAG: shikimate dehydrogenase [Clostridiales bacterium]|nr:shikimate dehydrogenase [Clostridiales bacterium]